MDDMTELDRQDRDEEYLIALVADTPNPWWSEGDEEDEEDAAR
jgi:hypothetical protein